MGARESRSFESTHLKASANRLIDIQHDDSVSLRTTSDI
jgi:hypothetical protein